MHRTPARTRTPRGGARPSLTLAFLAALVLGIPAGAARPALAQAAAPAPAETKPAAGTPTPGKAPDAKPEAKAPAAPAGAAPHAQAELPEQFKAVRAKIDAAKAELDAREKQLGHTDLTVTDLTAIRDSAATVTDEIRTLVTRLDAPVVPHMGWNVVRWPGNARLAEGLEENERFYFVHSYAARPTAGLDGTATTDHGGDFVAAFDKVMNLDRFDLR